MYSKPQFVHTRDIESTLLYAGALSQSLLLTQESSTDVTSGQEVCPEFSPFIEFVCVGTEVSYLEWQVNGVEIEPNFHIGDSAPREQINNPYIVRLEAKMQSIRQGELPISPLVWWSIAHQ